MRNKIIVAENLLWFQRRLQTLGCTVSGASRVTMAWLKRRRRRRRLNGSTRLLPRAKAAAYFNNASRIENALKCSPGTITDWPRGTDTCSEWCHSEREWERASVRARCSGKSAERNKKQRYKANFWLLRLSSRLHSDKRAARRQDKDTQDAAWGRRQGRVGQGDSTNVATAVLHVCCPQLQVEGEESPQAIKQTHCEETAAILWEKRIKLRLAWSPCKFRKNAAKNQFEIYWIAMALKII